MWGDSLVKSPHYIDCASNLGYQLEPRCPFLPHARKQGIIAGVSLLRAHYFHPEATNRPMFTERSCFEEHVAAFECFSPAAHAIAVSFLKMRHNIVHLHKTLLGSLCDRLTLLTLLGTPAGRVFSTLGRETRPDLPWPHHVQSASAVRFRGIRQGHHK